MSELKKGGGKMDVINVKDLYLMFLEMKAREQFENLDFETLSILQKKAKRVFYEILKEAEIDVNEFEKELNNKYMRLYFVEDEKIKFEFKDAVYSCIDSHMVEMLGIMLNEKGVI